MGSKLFFIFLSCVVACSMQSCATFYELNYEFNQYFEQGDLVAAEKALKSNSRVYRKRARFLYYANRGIVDHLVGEYEASNLSFEKAYIYGEDYHRNAAALAASFLTNPNVMDYPGEDHEHLLVLYYKALNYLYMEDPETALVECRRLNNRLNSLSDKYRSDKKYKEDAFVHTLMGLIYDANDDFNNAFIAYRNAYNIYQDDYTRMFGIQAPRQLKEDLLRCAYLTGFYEEVEFFEKEFGMDYEHNPSSNGDLVFLWNNGLGPFKDELSINFVTKENEGGVVFISDEMGWSFPFPLGDGDDDEKDKLTDLEIFRITLPKYVERPLRYESGYLEVGDQKYELELSEDINAIAFQSLQQRLLKELGQSLLRAALKKAVEEAVEEESEGWGLVIGIVNAATEKADTRNWQTIPHSIYYTRVPLSPGQNTINLKSADARFSGNIDTFTFEGGSEKTIFHSYQTLN